MSTTGDEASIRRLKLLRIASLVMSRALPPTLAMAAIPVLRRPDLALPLAGLSVWMIGEALSEHEVENRAAVESPEDAGTRRLVLGAHRLAWLAPLAEALVRDLPRDGARLVAGCALVAGGGALRIAAVRTLGRLFTAHVSIADDHVLCDQGPYRLVRHPAYLGLLLLNLGPSVAAGAWASLAVVAAATLFANARRVRVEEEVLLRKLGDVYHAYQRRTPRWVPRPT